jgi:8-oxo-dGTP pyrophosphatase MutT (NUDIX family)
LTPNRAGAVAIGRLRGRNYVLLVRAKGTVDRVFPKGHVEKGETLEDAALRELKEEGGFTGRILHPGGVVRYNDKKNQSEPVMTQYFLVRATQRNRQGEKGRKPIWVDPRVALTLLRYKNQQRLLRDLLPVIDRMEGSPPVQAADEFFLHDFAYLGQSLIANEEQGEKRVTFFITLVTAAVGALGFFGDKMEPRFAEPWPMVAAFALSGLSLFGIQTMRRVVERNVVSDGLKLRMDRVRRFFTRVRPSAYRPFLSYDPDRPKARDFKPVPLRGSGGWLDTVVMVNSAILGAVAGLLVWGTRVQTSVAGWFGMDWEGLAAGLIGIAVFALSWHIMHRVGSWLHRERWEKEAKRL